MMIIRSQDSYMRNYYAGVDKDKVIIVENSDNIQNHRESFRRELLAVPGIDAVSFTNCVPTRGAKVSNEVSWEGKDPLEKLHFWGVNSDFDYNKTVQISMIEGRFFDPSYSTDSTAYIINDIASRVMKIENPVGAAITFEGRTGIIIGVFKDFHAIDLAGPLVPTILQIKSGYKPFIMVKFSSGSLKGLTGQIEEIYRRYESEGLINATLFRDLTPFSDLNLPSRVVGIAFIIALFLACMGLYGIASFTSENRTKEIGIRKANGATTLSIIRLLIARYARWLIIAYLIAIPVALLFGKIFLGKFYFHTQIPLNAFIAGPTIAFGVAFLTVISQTWRVASMNPVKSLRYE
jgi:ABC-type antimicrobial peptide transport system permease subunit